MKDISIKYIEHCIGKIEHQLSREDIEDFIKEELKSKYQTYTDILEKLNFQSKTSDEKQAFRIQWLASQRKRNKPVDSKLKVIEIYDRIRHSIPYIEALASTNTNLLEMCNKQLEEIDFSYLSFGNRLESKKDLIVELSNVVDRNENSIHPEAVVKLKELLDYLQAYEA